MLRNPWSAGNPVFPTKAMFFFDTQGSASSSSTSVVASTLDVRKGDGL
jgi:hypothetical protein